MSGASNDREGNGLFRKVRGLFSGGDQSYNQYLEVLKYQHRHIDLKGLTTQGEFSLELSRVFVELGLGQQSRINSSQDLLQQVTPELMQGSHQIWDYLGNKNLPTADLVVLGAPGSGKTTLLKHVVISLVNNARSVKGLTKKVPIMLYLRDLAPHILKDPHFSLVRAVQYDLVGWQADLMLDWLDSDLRRKNCLILLDGLDEVADERTRRLVSVWVERQMKRYQGNQFVITSRPYGYEFNQLRNVLVLEVRPFSPDQVQQFVRSWYLEDEKMRTGKEDKGIYIEARRSAEDLLTRLEQTPVLMDLSVNPLLVTMIANIHRYRGVLPDRRVDLFEEICEVFLGKRRFAKGLDTDLVPDQKRQVIQPLAYHMMVNQTRELAKMEAEEVVRPFLSRVSRTTNPDEFLKMIVNTSGLLVERKSNVYSFAHQTFQEYLAAEHIRRNRLENQLEMHVEDSWWHETIRLYSAKGDATSIIRACVAPRPKASIPALTLALECLEESSSLSEEMRRLAENLTMMVENENPDIRRVGAEVLLTMRMRRLMRLDNGRYADVSFVTQAEYQLFLDEVKASGKYHQPDHWERDRYRQGSGRKPVVGIRPSDAEAFCEWLTARDKEMWVYRLPTAEECERLPRGGRTEATIGYWYRKGKAYQYSGPNGNISNRRWVQQFMDRLEARFDQDLFLSHQSQNATAVEIARRRIKERALQRRFALSNLERTLAIKPSPETLLEDWRRMTDRNTPAQAKELDLVLEKAFSRLDNPHLDHARDVVLTDIRRLALDLSQSLQAIPGKELYEPKVIGINRHLKLAHEITQKYSQLHKRDLYIHKNLLRNLGQALQDAHNLVQELNNNRIDARTRLRAVSLQYVIGILMKLETQQSQSAEDTMVKKRFNLMLHRYVDLYIDVALIEERIKSNLPALEGIRIIRVRPEYSMVAQSK